MRLSVNEPAVLGIAAGRTLSEPSGVALFRRVDLRWRCLRTAPSVASFGAPVPWEGEVAGGPIDVRALLDTCSRLLGGVFPVVVAASLPMARLPVKPAPGSGARHRAKQLGVRLHRGFKAAGFELVTRRWAMPDAGLIEVHPRIALSALMDRPAGIHYEWHNTWAYWPDLPIAARRRKLVDEWHAVLWRAGRDIRGIDLPLPEHPESWTLRRLKRFQDAIDAVACAWVGTRFLNGTARPVGDRAAAVWVPQAAARDGLGR